MIGKVLRTIGLTENEVIAYLTLLKLTNAPASVVGKRAKMDRSQARYSCRSLVKHGLVQESQKGNTFFYTVEPPERILHILEERKSSIVQQQFQVNQFMGILKAMENPAIMCPSVEYYEGREGIIKVYEDILETGEDVYCWTNFEQKKEILGQEYIDKYIPRRLKKNITVHTLEQKMKGSEKEVKKYEKLKCNISFVDVLPIKNGEVRIYGEKIAFITFNAQKPTVFIFTSKEISGVFKAIFDGFWVLANS